MTDSRVVAGLDIGTRNIRVLLGEYDPQGKLLVSGWGEAPSDGLRRGVVVNIEAARECIEQAVEAAEQEAGRTVTELWVSLAGGAVSSLNSRGVVPVSGKNREIGDSDVERVLEAARAVAIPMDRIMLNVLPQQFIIDDQRGIRNPRDMIGVRLEADVHIVTASLSATENLKKAVERAGFKVKDMALGTLASAKSLLNEDEKELGVLLIDIGAGSTDFILVHEGAPLITGTVPVGGSQVTSDLSIVLKTPREAAERIKINDAYCWENPDKSKEPVIVPGVGGRPPVPVPCSELCRILQPRMEEIFRMIQAEISRVPEMAQTVEGVVLCGGGSRLTGVEELASRVFERPARTGSPLGNVQWPQACRAPEWSAAAGLVLLGDALGGNGIRKRDIAEAASAHPLKGLVRWLGEFF
ncbi:MAG: cell division protein FtsA [Spirochaetales bacterium]|nr:MAG: cell division protein FtsA [Spirochaetales bacterium]